MKLSGFTFEVDEGLNFAQNDQALFHCEHNGTDIPGSSFDVTKNNSFSTLIAPGNIPFQMLLYTRRPDETTVVANRFTIKELDNTTVEIKDDRRHEDHLCAPQKLSLNSGVGAAFHFEGGRKRPPATGKGDWRQFTFSYYDHTHFDGAPVGSQLIVVTFDYVALFHL